MSGVAWRRYSTVVAMRHNTRVGFSSRDAAMLALFFES